jgi:hypothetical protein
MRLFLTDVFVETLVAVVNQGVGQLRDGRTVVVERTSGEDMQSYLELVLVAGSVYRMIPMRLLEGEWRGAPLTAWTEPAELGRHISARKQRLILEAFGAAEGFGADQGGSEVVFSC